MNIDHKINMHSLAIVAAWAAISGGLLGLDIVTDSFRPVSGGSEKGSEKYKRVS